MSAEQLNNNVVIEKAGEKFHMTRNEAGEPLVKDLELARWLGFGRDRDIRQLINRWSAELGEVSRYRAAKPNSPEGGRPEEGFLLTEQQALFIAAKSETPRASEILKRIIEVFVAVRRGGQVRMSPKEQARLADALSDHDMQIRSMQATIELLAAELKPATAQQQPAPQLSAPIEMEVGNLKIKVRSVEEASVLLAQLRSDAQPPTPVEASIAPTAQRASGKKAKAKAQTRRSPSKELSQSRKELAAHLMLYAAQVGGSTDWAGRTKAWSLFYDALAEKGYDPRLRRVKGQRPIDVMDAEGRIDWALKIAREAFPIAK